MTDLTDEHYDALVGCFNAPLPCAEVGDDQQEWELFYELRDAGLVAFGEDSEEIEITDAGYALLD